MTKGIRFEWNRAIADIHAIAIVVQKGELPLVFLRRLHALRRVFDKRDGENEGRWERYCANGKRRRYHQERAK